MPTVAVIGPYRFFFCSGDRAEACHIHVTRDRCTAKFWLDPVRLDRSKGFPDRELLRVQRIVEEHQTGFQEKWDEYFGS